MNKNQALEGINEYVREFLSGDDDKSRWNSTENQQKLYEYILENKIKMKKKSDEPLKPKSAFDVFFAEEKSKLSHPAGKQDINKIVQDWRSLKTDIEAFNVYALLAKQDKDRYDNEMLEYRKANNLSGKKKWQERKEKKETRLKEKETDKPKTAYWCFIKEEKSKLDPSLDKKDVLTALQKRWKELKKEDPDRVEMYKKMCL